MVKFSLKPGRPSKDNPYRVGQLQKEVLSEIASHPEDAHGVGIARALRAKSDTNMPDAQVYVALRRMEARGLIELIGDVDHLKSPSEQNRPRGRPRKLYALTESGKRAIDGSATTSSGSEPDRYRKDRHGKQNGVGVPA